MPLPSFPTGTVSGEPRRDRTFPPSDADARETTDSPSPSSPRRTGGRAVPGAAPSDAARRDGGSSSPDSPSDESLRDRVARLERENEALRRKVERSQRARQDVIDRYEHLIDDITGASAASSGDETTPTVRSPAPNDGLADRVARRLDVRER